MNDDELYEILGYVLASEYRVNTIKSIGTSLKIPSNIAADIDLRTNHVSNILKDLKKKNIVVCLNEQAKKGRIYKNTDLGLEILKYLQ